MPHTTTYPTIPLAAECDIRDVFALNAPPVPNWFNPEMIGRPQLPTLSDVFSTEECEDITKCYDHESGEWADSFDPPHELHDRVVDYYGRSQEYWDAFCEWQSEANRQRLAQWPYFYAEMQMGERAKNLPINNMGIAAPILLEIAKELAHWGDDVPPITTRKRLAEQADLAIRMVTGHPVFNSKTSES